MSGGNNTSFYLLFCFGLLIMLLETSFHCFYSCTVWKHPPVAWNTDLSLRSKNCDLIILRENTSAGYRNRSFSSRWFRILYRTFNLASISALKFKFHTWNVQNWLVFENWENSKNRNFLDRWFQIFHVLFFNSAPIWV